MVASQNPYELRLHIIRQLWRDNRWLYAVAGLILGILIDPAIELFSQHFFQVLGNLVPEAFGIVFTVLILDRLADNRARDELKFRLLNEMKSSTNGTAVTALDWLRNEKWLDDSMFQQADLERVNWENAYIGNLNLEGANLIEANLAHVTNRYTRDKANLDIQTVNLSHTRLYRANLSNADLQYVRLDDADCQAAIAKGANFSWATMREIDLRYSELADSCLTDADLKGALLRHANLKGAIMLRVRLSGGSLSYADMSNVSLRCSRLDGVSFRKSQLLNVSMQGADLSGANMLGAILVKVEWAYPNGDYPAILPDGETWTPETDMTKFTDSRHPEYRVTRMKINDIRAALGYERFTT